MVISYVLLDLLFPKLSENKPLSPDNRILKLHNKKSKIDGDNGYISTNSGQNALKISGAVKNIVEHGTLKLKNNKFNGFEVMQVLAMSGMAFSD